MTAYEVSICKLAAYDNIECFDLDEEFGIKLVDESSKVVV